MKRFTKCIQILFCMLFLVSCSTTSKEADVILLQQKNADTDVTPAIRVERVAVETKLTDQKTVYEKAPKSIPAGGLSWLAKEVQTGTPAKLVKYYDVTYDYFGNELSRTYVYGADEKLAAANRVRQYGSKVETGAYFRPKFSRYGLDCKGCGGEFTGSGNTAIGIKLDKELGVQQANGEWQEGVTWEGYYIVAADKSIPFCSIIEISNHNFSGYGISPNEPFKAIVLDRGGVIRNNKLDLYIGSESNLHNSIKYVANRTPLAKILRVGGLYKKSGKYSCKL